MSHQRELDEIQKAIQVGQRKLRFLQLEQRQLAEDIKILKRVRGKMIKSLRQVLAQYEAIQARIQEIADGLPFTDDERNEMELQYDAMQSGDMQGAED